MQPRYTLPTTTPARQTAGPDVQEQLTEIWGIVRRRPGLTIACLVISFMLGTLYYVSAPRTFESKAELLLMTKRYSISGNEESESPVYEKTMETHAEMVCQPLIVGRALVDYDLAALPSLAEEEDPVTAIIDNLSAHLTNENATIIEVSYRSSIPEDAKEVVEAITTTYMAYLREENQETGKETVDLIREASENLLESLANNQQIHQEFQRSAPLIWRDGRGINIHHERQASIEAKRHELMTDRTILTAKIEAINEAIESGSVSREALHYEAMNSFQLNQEDTTWRAFQMADRERYAEREAARSLSTMLVAEYVRLEVQESEMLDEFGEGHPTVESVIKRKTKISNMLNRSIENQTRISEILGETIATEDGSDYVTIYLQKLTDELAVIDRQISALDIAFSKEQKAANQMQEFLLKDTALSSEYENTKQLFDVVVTRLQEIDLINNYGGDTLTIVSPAKVGEQVAPRLLLVLLGSFVLGSISGCGLAWLRERSENMFRSLQEIRETLGVPVIGRIPTMNASQLTKRPEYTDFDASILTLHNEASPISEAFRGVRTSLFFSTTGQNHQVIQVTSPLPGDGKSTVTANLGVTIAKSGKRVLVIDADFRRPALTEMFGLRSKPKDNHGLAGIIAGRSTLESTVVPTAVENLFFLPVCDRPTQPSEMLSTPEFGKLIDEVRESFDIVLIDTPPILPVTDPCVVAARVDGVVVTLRIRRGVQEAAKRAMEMLRDVDAKVVGVVANGWQPQNNMERNSYGYGNSYGQGNENGWATKAANGKHPSNAVGTAN
jgi:succinoglycan biosynthesis transport protein ExoP